MTESANIELEVELDNNGDLFYFLGRSYMDLYSNCNLELSSESEIESCFDISETFEFNFLISFPVEGENYHFDLFIDEIDLSEYDLYPFK
ncbi:hypothetical protein [Flavicella sp.]|uniref:hypothetical protein n=1 Tax=Flavicella sp. TaxID=2957742 RepID=UPI00301A1896